MLYTGGKIFLTINFKYFDFIERYDLNSSSNSLFEILSIKDFLVEFLVNFLSDSPMWLFILPNLTYSS